MTNDLASKVLLNNTMPMGVLHRYVLPNYEHVAYIYHDEKIIRITQADEVLIPTQDEEINWDEVLIQMLNHSVHDDNHRDITVRNLYKSQWNSCFQNTDFTPEQVIAHPSFTAAMPLLRRHNSELCPKDTAFILPAPALLGVYATRENCTDVGMSIIYAHRVVKVSLGVLSS